MEMDKIELHERFLTLFTANEPAIRACVRRLVPTRQDAADVMQNVALILWRKFEELEEVEKFRAWAFGIVRYEALAWKRDQARNRLVLADDVLDIIASQSLKIDAQLEIQRDSLEACLNKLPAEQKELVLAAYKPDSKIQQLSKRSGRTVAGFYQWLHRMRVRLVDCTRRTLQAEGLS